MPRLARRFLALEILSPEWRDALERFLKKLQDCETAGAHCAPLRPPLTEDGTRTAECRPYTAPEPEDPEACARWLACSLYKYWMDALDDGNLLGRVDRSLDMLRLGMAMDRALPGEGPFLRRISREIEHCEENLAALLKPPG